LKPLKVLISSGLVPYESGLETQLEILRRKKSGEEEADVLWLLSHEPVITFGASRDSQSNLIKDPGIPKVKVSRGGDITYHDPGQVTGYLLFSLGEEERNLHLFLNKIEKSLLSTLSEAGITGHREDGKTGVFLDQKKICSIGIACRHWITYHGFSLNFKSDMSVYGAMNPCGLESTLMANLSELRQEYSRQEFLQSYPEYCASIFSRKIEEVVFQSYEDLRASLFGNQVCE